MNLVRKSPLKADMRIVAKYVALIIKKDIIRII